MATAIVVSLYVFSPILVEEWQHRFGKNEFTVDQTEFSIVLPSIGVAAPVVAKVDWQDEAVYKQALQAGVAHAAGTALPGEPGSVYLFSHSSDMPWRMTRYNTAFFRLSRVKPGELIEIRYEGEVYRYQIREKKVVWPSEVEFLTSQETTQLVLQTCTPIGTAYKRLLVLADPE